MSKQQRKAALEQWKRTQRADLLAGMPLSPEQLDRLLDYLDKNLEACDHTPKLTAIFLTSEELEGARTLAWLGDHGGYCDCEVLANLADLDAWLKAPPAVVRLPAGSQEKRAPKEKRAPRSLQTITGWNLSHLPAPWRVANLYTPNEPVKLELGKQGGCSLQIVESPLPTGDRTADAFWTQLWYDRAQLPPRGELQVTHGVLRLPEGFESTVVHSPSWTPVYGWVVPTADTVPAASTWRLEIATGLNRWAGDLPQIASLIACLARGPAENA